MRRVAQIMVIPSVREGVSVEFYALAVDGTMWLLENPWESETWKRIPDLPGDEVPPPDRQRAAEIIPHGQFDRLR